MSLPIFGDKSVGAGGLWLSPLSYNFAQQSGWSFARSGAIQAHVPIADGASVSLEK